LDKLKIRLAEKQNKVRWIVDDLTHSKELNKLEKVDLWHDRAVLHFFTELKEQNAYFDLVKKLVKQDGYAIIASFSVGGANKCSGLPIHQYDVNLLKEKLGENFTLVDSFDYTYTMPSGDSRAYIYTLFKKVN